jgi:hypothetical protein
MKGFQHIVLGAASFKWSNGTHVRQYQSCQTKTERLIGDSKITYIGITDQAKPNNKMTWLEGWNVEDFLHTLTGFSILFVFQGASRSLVTLLLWQTLV